MLGSEGVPEAALSQLTTVSVFAQAADMVLVN